MNGTQLTKKIDNAALFEKVMLKSDLSGLSPIETVQHIKNVCDSLDLNPLTNPLAVIEFQGKKILYFRKEATEQLRQNRKVSITKLETKLHDGGLYVVTAYAAMPDGKTDSSTGAISIGALKGDALANAMMKAETKAKRRVTLSICGLGFMDESEAESLRTSHYESPLKKVIEEKKLEIANQEPIIVESKTDYSLDVMLLQIEKTDSIGQLQTIYMQHYKTCAQARDGEGMRRLIEAKDKRKKEIDESIKDFNTEIDAAENNEVQS